MHRRLALAPIAVLLAAWAALGCQASWYGRAADAHAAAGRWDHAVSNYRAALDREVPPRSEAGAALRERLARAAEALVEQRLTHARARVAGGEAEAALAELASLRRQVAAWQASPRAEAAVLSAMTEAAEALWPEVARLLDPTAYARALARAERIASPFRSPDAPAVPADHPVLRRLAEAAEAAARHHLSLAYRASAHPAAALLHLSLATRFGADPGAALEATRREVEAATRLSWQVTAEGPCAAEGRALADALPRGPGLPVALRLTLRRCAPREERWTTSEAYTYQEREPFVAEEKVQVGTDKAGQPKHEVLKVTRHRLVERSGQRDVQHVRVSYALIGRAVLTWGDQSLTLPVEVELEREDRAWKTPHGERAFDGTASPGALRAEAVGRAREAVQARARDVTTWWGKEHLVRAFSAGAEARPFEAEHHFVLALRLLGYVPAAAGAAFHRRYGLTPAELERAVRGDRHTPQALAVPADPPLPAPDAAAAEALSALAPLRTPRETEGPNPSAIALGHDTALGLVGTRGATVGALAEGPGGAAAGGWWAYGVHLRGGAVGRDRVWDGPGGLGAQVGLDYQLGLGVVQPDGGGPVGVDLQARLGVPVRFATWNDPLLGMAALHVSGELATGGASVDVEALRLSPLVGLRAAFASGGALRFELDYALAPAALVLSERARDVSRLEHRAMLTAALGPLGLLARALWWREGFEREGAAAVGRGWSLTGGLELRL